MVKSSGEVACNVKLFISGACADENWLKNNRPNAIIIVKVILFIINYLDKKEKQIIEQRESLNKILPDLEKLQELQTKQEAEIFLGKKGLRTAYEKLLKNTTKNDELLFFYIHNEKYGEVRTPKGLYNTFNGKIFNKEFSKKGHNKMEFKICMCNK